jgi:transposase
LKVGQVGKAGVAARVRELVAGQAMLEAVATPVLQARETLRERYAVLHRRLLAIARGDEVCGRLMTVPGVGPVVAPTFKAGVDDPARFARSGAVGAHFGLVPRKHQSGGTNVTGGISKVGDATVRTALFEAANVMLSRTVRASALKAWALRVAARRGGKRAKVALARKLAVVLHRIWVDGTSFRWKAAGAAATT